MQVIQHHRNRGMPSGGGGRPRRAFYMHLIRDFYRAFFFKMGRARRPFSDPAHLRIWSSQIKKYALWNTQRPLVGTKHRYNICPVLVQRLFIIG